MPRRRNVAHAPRRGALMLELGIVLGIAILFLALLFPHFQRARNVARRVQCLNNLKNIALALQNYSEAHECFPPGYVARGVTAEDPASAEQGPGWGWGAMILPHVEQGAMARAFNYSLDVPGSGTIITPYLCPDGLATTFSVTSDFAGLVTLPPANFVGVAGRGSLTLEPGRPQFPGIFYRNSSVRQDDITDGLSQTLMLGERRSVSVGPDGQPLQTSSTWIGAVTGVFRDAGYADGTRLAGPGSLVLGVVGETRPVALKLTPNGAPAGIGFSSPHAEGVNFSRADGSCSAISPQIDADVFMRLGQRSDMFAGGEP
ncbi:MAG TPA: DUF1559 domain-containing protein [Caulifigura sp.]|nr:DUF1559 domain-containing protein [Caulifigura sp.]